MRMAATCWARTCRTLSLHLASSRHPCRIAWAVMCKCSPGAAERAACDFTRLFCDWACGLISALHEEEVCAASHRTVVVASDRRALPATARAQTPGQFDAHVAVADARAPTHRFSVATAASHCIRPKPALAARNGLTVQCRGLAARRPPPSDPSFSRPPFHPRAQNSSARHPRELAPARSAAASFSSSVSAHVTSEPCPPLARLAPCSCKGTSPMAGRGLIKHQRRDRGPAEGSNGLTPRAQGRCLHSLISPSFTTMRRTRSRSKVERLLHLPLHQNVSGTRHRAIAFSNTRTCPTKQLPIGCDVETSGIDAHHRRLIANGELASGRSGSPTRNWARKRSDCYTVLRTRALGAATWQPCYT